MSAAREEIAILESWIKDGAAWPDETEKLPQTPTRLAAPLREAEVLNGGHGSR
jgi:hypothetical protein